MLPQAWINYLLDFHTTRDYFECHEHLEDHWKEEGMKHNYWVGFIQAAVSLYHQRRGNYSGALRMMNSACRILSEEQNRLEQLGIDKDVLLSDLSQRIKDLEQKKPFADLNLPLQNNVQTLCIKEARQLNIPWGAPSDLENNGLLHKHKMRDRTEVISERKRQLITKNRFPGKK